MRGLFLTVSVLISYQSMALTVIHDAQIDNISIVSANKYMRFNPAESQQAPLKSFQGKTPGLPAKSNVVEGLFDSYKLKECQQYPTPFFVVGPDSLSIEWLKAHSNHLKEVHALGLVTNIENEEGLKEINEISPINLIPSNVDELAQVVQAKAYPFYTNGCEVWQ